jgi:hypothetical protein
MTWPVTPLLSGEARKSTTWHTSAMVNGRFRVSLARVLSTASAPMLSSIEVCTTEGATTLQVTPESPSSWARTRDSSTTALLLAA